MDEIFAVPFQAIAELVAEVLSGLLSSWLGDRQVGWATHPVAVLLAWLVAGAVLGALSLLVLPATLLSHPALRVANLLLAPVLAAAAAHGLAR